MELASHIIKQTKEKSRAFSQITLDDDYIVKDNKPDVIKIVHTDGTIVFEETRLSNQALWVTGKLEFFVLYRSDDERCRMETLGGSIPFQEKLTMEGAAEMDPVRVSGEVEDLTIGLINSRKLSVRAVANIKALVEEHLEEEIVGGLTDCDGCQQKVAEKEFLSVLSAEKDVVRFHGEVKLTNAKPNINKLLWHDIQLRNTESGIVNGKIHIQGDIYFGAVYIGEDGSQIEWVESTLPFSREVEGVDLKDEKAQLLWLTIRPEGIEVEPRNDYDGESRIFGVDISFAVEYKVWKEEKLPVLMDAYALDRKLDIKREKCASMCFLMKNEAKIRVSETNALESNQEKILQICSCTGKITVDRAVVEENGIRFEGVVTVHMLYLTADDNYPVAHAQTLLPFEQTVEVNGMQKDTWYDYTTSLDMLAVNLMDSSEYEVKAAFRIAVLAFSENCFDKIASLEEAPPDMDELGNQAGLVGYVVQEKEELWDIAKRYHTTIDEIVAANNLKMSGAPAGTKLIIIKKVDI